MSIADSPSDETQVVGSREQPANSSALSENDQHGGVILKNRYVIERELARGGIGIVYLARDLRLFGKQVVIKVLSGEMDPDAWVQRKFQEEIEALARISHPAVIGALDSGQMNDGRRYIVMEFVNGVTLRSVMNPEGMDFKRTANIVRQIGRALRAVHEHGIFHRDLKPENIMLQQLSPDEENVKIIDFGIATIRRSELTTVDITSVVAGTPDYMAPEQLMGKPSVSSDIYALGVITFEMLTGERPFQTDSPYKLYELQRTGVKTNPKELRKDLPVPAEAMILKALSFDPEDRYQQAKDFGDELARVLTLNIGGNHPNNLPIQPTPLIGREVEIATIKALLQTQGTRLITLTGAGGTGKTRLALHLAASLLANFSDGVFLVSLGTISEPGLVAYHIAQTLQIKVEQSVLVAETLKEHLRRKQVLLLLDNFEQVSPAAPLLSVLLADCPELRILVTSRSPLHLRGEHEFSVPPLALPTPRALPSIETLIQYAAVALFLQRALTAKSTFAITKQNAQAVAEICIRLDGLPLAIELAAARIKLLTPEAMLSRLDNRLKFLTGGARDLPTRQQTMRSTIEWSYELLKAEERQLFRRMGVFVGGFTLEAAESVYNDAGELHLDLLEGIESLINESLLQHLDSETGEPRFEMLETIRDYALESLYASGEAAATTRAHAEYFLTLAEGADRDLRDQAFTHTAQSEWLNRLEKDHDNFRAVLRWATRESRAEIGLRLAGSLERFWVVRGHHAEGRRWLQTFEVPEQDENRSILAKAFATRARIAHHQGDYQAAISFLEQSLRLYGAISNLSGVAGALMLMAMTFHRQGDYARAENLYNESLMSYRQLNDKRGIADILGGLGVLAFYQGNYEGAIPILEEALQIHKEIGNKLAASINLNNLGVVFMHRGNPERARLYYEESEKLHQELGHKVGIATTKNNLAWMALEDGDYLRASDLYKDALHMFREIGDRQNIPECLEGLATIASNHNQLERATRLLASSTTMRKSFGIASAVPDRTRYERTLNSIRSKLSGVLFDEHWAKGQSMSLSEAVAEALEELELPDSEHCQYLE